jgi:hypothetical protein
MDAHHDATEAPEVEVIYTGEELLLKARALARQIEERVRQTIDQHSMSTHHRRSRPEE